MRYRSSQTLDDRGFLRSSIPHSLADKLFPVFWLLALTALAVSFATGLFRMRLALRGVSCGHQGLIGFMVVQAGVTPLALAMPGIRKAESVVCSATAIFVCTVMLFRTWFPLC